MGPHVNCMAVYTGMWAHMLNALSIYTGTYEPTCTAHGGIYWHVGPHTKCIECIYGHPWAHMLNALAVYTGKWAHMLNALSIYTGTHEPTCTAHGGIYWHVGPHAEYIECIY